MPKTQAFLMGNQEQVFQSKSDSRWKRIKWTSRVILAFLLFILTVIIVASIFATAPSLPNIDTKNKYFENALNNSNAIDLSPTQRKKYKGFKTFLEQKDKEDSINKIRGKIDSISTQKIRAVFYSPANNYAASLSDLDSNAKNINLIFPEWFFIDSVDNNKIDIRIDSAGYAIMKRNNLRILPILTNFNSIKNPHPDFDGSLLHKMLNNEILRTAFINKLVDTILKYKLQGINIDFEEVNETTSEPLSNFQKQLYESFHAKGLLVTDRKSVV